MLKIVIPFLKRIKRWKVFCSFKDGFNNAINIASRFLWISFFKIFYHVLTTLLRCFFLFRWCNLLHIHKPHSKLYFLGITFYPSNETEFEFFLFPNWLWYNFFFFFVKLWNFFKKCFDFISLFWQNGNFNKMKRLLTSKKYGGIRG